MRKTVPRKATGEIGRNTTTGSGEYDQKKKKNTPSRNGENDE